VLPHLDRKETQSIVDMYALVDQRGVNGECYQRGVNGECYQRKVNVECYQRRVNGECYQRGAPFTLLRQLSPSSFL
jgi:hypothetical protein